MLRMTDILAAKRDGRSLSEAEIRFFIEGYTRDEIPDYQASALLMAIFLNGLEDRELNTWADAMLHSGEVLDLSDIPGAKVDKHSTGGVGDKISLPLAPLVAEAGLIVPMISGRGLGHTGGTLDKLESIPGFRTDLPVDRLRALLRTFGFGLIGQTARIAPADRKLYALRDATSTVECIPLIASSIMSKKLAEGLDALVLDVKVGSGAFMKRREDARALAETMIRIGEAAGCRVRALLTDMDQPLGRAVGNALEVAESVDVLRGEGPSDVRDLTLELGAEMLVLGDRARTVDEARETLAAILDSGAALDRFAKLADAQGGDAEAVLDPSRLPRAERTVVLEAPRDGFVERFLTDDVGRAAMVLGAGRARKEDTVDPAVGLVLEVERGDRVERGQPLVTLHVNAGSDVEGALGRLGEAIRIGDEAPAEVPLVLERLGVTP
ncbi:MAG: thymidine phosphorylase [Deltaproteobacteria bacterium]|nr:MAG: thymidine phosphorylase [Deltaproteobacteria bacterium]